MKHRIFTGMKRITLLSSALVVVMALGLQACRDKKKPEPVNPDPEPTQGTLKINFIPKFNGAPFAFNTDYYNPLNQRMQFELLKFLTTNFYAHTTSGDSILVKDAFKFDMETGLMSFTTSLDPGDFTGMRFGFGVDPSRNHLDPTTYDASHPLSYNQSNTLHWGWAAGYVFMKFEGKADISGTGTGPLSTFLAYHPGDDVCYNPTPFLPKAFSITVGNTTTLNLDINIDGFFTQPTDTLDVSVDNFTHFNDNPALAKRVAANASKSFSFE